MAIMPWDPMTAETPDDECTYGERKLSSSEQLNEEKARCFKGCSPVKSSDLFRVSDVSHHDDGEDSNDSSTTSSSHTNLHPNAHTEPYATASNIVSVQTVPAPPPPHDMIKDFESRVIKLTRRISPLRQQRSDLLECRYQSVAKEQLVTQKKRIAEARLEAAIKAEDFHLARHISTVIVKLELMLEEIAPILEKIGHDLKKLEPQMQKEMDGVKKDFQIIMEFKREQESKDKAAVLRDLETVSKKLSVEKEQLQKEKEMIEKIEKNESRVVEDRKKLENKFSQKKIFYQQMLDTANDAIPDAEKDITEPTAEERTEEQLLISRALLAELHAEAATAVEELLRIHDTSAVQLAKVQDDEKTIGDKKKEWELKHASHDRGQKAHDAEVTESSKALLARDQSLDAINKQVEMALVVVKWIGPDAVSDEVGESNDDLTQIRVDVIKCEAEIKEARFFFRGIFTTSCGSGR